MTNTSAVAASCNAWYHLPTTDHLLAAGGSTRTTQLQTQWKACLNDEKYLSFLENKTGEWTIVTEKWQDRRSKRTRQKKTREETGKGKVSHDWNSQPGSVRLIPDTEGDISGTSAARPPRDYSLGRGAHNDHRRAGSGTVWKSRWPSWAQSRP